MAAKNLPYKPMPTDLPLWWKMWFWENNYQENLENGCLEWKGRRKVRENYYPQVRFNGKDYPAHRIGYFLTYNDDPGDLLVRHTCHNRLCASPFHLVLGTHWDNTQDMIRAGRNQAGDQHWSRRNPKQFAKIQGTEGWQRQQKRIVDLNGENHPCTKLTAEIVREIKKRSAEGADNRTLAKLFGVTHSNVSAIVLGKSWAHIEGPVREQDNKFAPKVTADDVREIRRLHKAGETNAELGRQFKVGANAIFKIVNNLSWKHVE